MYQFDMTDDEVKRAEAAAKLVIGLAKAEQLSNGLEIGAQLLRGRAFAMKAAGVNKPMGRAYAEAFAEWKKAFGFPDGKEHAVLYSNAIVCAEHRVLADEIIADLSLKQKMDMGIFGLASRVRKMVEKLEGGPPKAKARRSSTREHIERMSGEMADIRDELAAARASDPEKHWRAAPEAVGRTMAMSDADAFRRLIKAGLAVLEEEDLDEEDADGDGEEPGIDEKPV
jgi:hypothetical protein